MMQGTSSALSPLLLHAFLKAEPKEQNLMKLLYPSSLASVMLRNKQPKTEQFRKTSIYSFSPVNKVVGSFADVFLAKLILAVLSHVFAVDWRLSWELAGLGGL